ncbi:hypothetical protein F5Y18DRAFT_366155 [Xylariaceae sp. FL1019]|nr:hypothetical protein F5Y18DRAFT_366155 [Xylariaceae sp. FL1019]
MSTEIWQPEVGDYGIENQEDLGMISEMRRQHHAVAKAHARRRDQVISAGKKAGVKLGQIDMTRVFLGPEIDFSEDECEDGDNDEYDQLSAELAEPAVSIETIAANNATTMIHSKLKISQTSSKVGKRKIKRRRHKSDDDATVRDDMNSDDMNSDDESEPGRKRVKKTLTTNSRPTGQWRARTRSGSTGVGGLDGSDDMSISGKTATSGVGNETASDTTYYFGEGRFTQEPQSMTEHEQENGTGDKGFLHRVAKMLTFST